MNSPPRYRPRVEFARRYCKLILAALAFGYAAALAGLISLELSLPPSDGASGSILLFLINPMVQMIVIMIVLFAVGIATPLLRWMLWRTPLRTTVPIVGITVILVGFATGGWLHVLAAVPTFFAALAAGALCGVFWRPAPDAGPGPPEVS